MPQRRIAVDRRVRGGASPLGRPDRGTVSRRGHAGAVADRRAGHAPRQRPLLGLVHDAHAAAAQFAEDHEIAQLFRRACEPVANRNRAARGRQDPAQARAAAGQAPEAFSARSANRGQVAAHEHRSRVRRRRARGPALLRHAVGSRRGTGRGHPGAAGNTAALRGQRGHGFVGRRLDAADARSAAPSPLAPGETTGGRRRAV